MRKDDYMTRGATFLSQNRNNVGRNKKYKKPSFIKRQILIQEAFSRIKDKKSQIMEILNLHPNSQ